MKFLITFIILSIINVIFSTIRSITTIKGDKFTASVISGAYFAFYNIMLIYTVADFPMWQKCVITFICNVIGVYVVKYIEEKARKDKLWAIRFTVKDNEREKIINELEDKDISYGYDIRGKYIVFETFCNSKKETLKVEEIVKKFNAKYFISENKIVF